MEKKDFDLYPLKLKALDSTLGPKAPQTLELRQKLQTTNHLQSPVVFYGITHITRLHRTHYCTFTFGLS